MNQSNSKEIKQNRRRTYEQFMVEKKKMKTKIKILIIIPIVVGLAISIPFIISSTSGGPHYTQEIDPRILEATNGFAIASNMDIYRIGLIDEGQSLFFTVSQNTDGFISMDDPLMILQKIYPENKIVSFEILVLGEEIPYTLEDGQIIFGVNNAHIIEIRGFSEYETITNFEECIAAGNPVMESYPRQCRTADGLHFVEEIESQSSDCSGSAGCYTDYVNRIVDGDTIHTATLKIRLSLTNTPESYQEGFQAATDFTKSLCPVGSKIIVDQDDLQKVDQYGRVLAKVYCGDKILNSELLYNGHANILTQYCLTSEFSGETWAQRYGCRASVSQDASSEIIEPIPDQYTCDPSYPDFCIPFNSPDLDCGDILERDFTVIGSDPHRFDGDGDGIGCES